MIKSFETYINEMAMPTNIMKNKLWYHGTSEESAIKILNDGYLKPSELVTKRTKRFMAPQFNRVYLTSDLEEGIGYAFFRSGNNLKYDINDKKYSFAYLVTIDGKELVDVNPDEDIIADKIYDLDWLQRLAKNYTPKEYKKYMDMGDYAYGTNMGKKLMNYLSYDQKIELIELGWKLANEDKIKIKEVWKIDMQFKNEINKNINDWKKYSTKL